MRNLRKSKDTSMLVPIPFLAAFMQTKSVRETESHYRHPKAGVAANILTVFYHLNPIS